MVADVLVLLGLHFYGVSLEKEKDQPFDDTRIRLRRMNTKKKARRMLSTIRQSEMFLQIQFRPTRKNPENR
jgi:hypothetical protein